MRKMFLLFLIIPVLFPAKTHAASQDECAIWLCLPGGFPQGCEKAYSAFRYRLKKGRAPLPDLSSCTTDGKTTGHYEIGRELYESCEEGYVLRSTVAWQEYTYARCYREDCSQNRTSSEGMSCEHYDAVKREKPNYIKLWVDGAYLGQFFY